MSSTLSFVLYAKYLVLYVKYLVLYVKYLVFCLVCQLPCLVCQVPCVVFGDVPLVEFLYLVSTRMPGESYRRRLRSLLLYLCYVFPALINSLVC